ncbi:4776_t:CDS:2 [Funneliformis mosseae]|uniref:4776_t:CDS:1 n=1 Tax=Funneliformis mosseae TaxID=27381 RepID=A0A9N8VRF6_FUNMO|nr:4776_t:CDS:2 [Funneliformis mosseae]
MNIEDAIMIHGKSICKNQAEEIHVTAIDPEVSLAKKRNSIKRAQVRMRKHIQNLVDEVHKKPALWLTKTFDIIVLPRFNITQMSRRQKEINSKTFRKMMSWTHAKFRN